MAARTPDLELGGEKDEISQPHPGNPPLMGDSTLPPQEAQSDGRGPGAGSACQMENVVVAE